MSPPNFAATLPIHAYERPRRLTQASAFADHLLNTDKHLRREPTGIAASLDATMADRSDGQDEESPWLRPGMKEEGLAYYQALKETLGRTHLKAAGFLTGYLFLTASSDVRYRHPSSLSPFPNQAHPHWAGSS